MKLRVEFLIGINLHYTYCRQKCKFCGKDVVGLIDRLKEHLIKCEYFPADFKEPLDLTTSKIRKTNVQPSPN